MRKLRHNIEMTSEITKQANDQNNTFIELISINTHKTDDLLKKRKIHQVITGNPV